jgi:hypothetical protein
VARVTPSSSEFPARSDHCQAGGPDPQPGVVPDLFQVVTQILEMTERRCFPTLLDVTKWGCVTLCSPSDDLGYPVRVARPVSRVVSLVPSLTEAVAVTRQEALVGATQWCSHPPGMNVRRVRGTKNPDLAAVIGLRPDIILANKEENRRLDVERLRAAGLPVWVTDIRTLDEAFTSLRRIFGAALGWPEPSWLAHAEEVWREPAPDPPVRAVIAIWRDPWMVVGSGTFAGDIAARLGLRNVYGSHEERYPHVDLDDVAQWGDELIVLPDEPYPFTQDDGPEMFPRHRVALVEGRSLTWYGPSLVTARSTLLAQLDGGNSGLLRVRPQ